MKKIICATVLLTLAACGNTIGGGGDGGEGVAAVQPSQVTPADLRAAATDPRLVRFYQARDWQPVWNAQSAGALVQTIRGATRHGLEPRLFLDGVTENQAPAAREAALTLAALSYAQALAQGRADPKRLQPVYEVPRPDPDLAAGLNQAVGQDQVGEWLNGLAPQDEEYRLLSEAYVAAVRQAGADRPAAIPTGDAIRPGGSDPRLPAIVQALRAGNHLPPAQGEGGAPTTYSPELVAAVRQVQADHGIEADGIIQDDTIAAINHGAAERARTLAVNLERRRWLPREAPATRIDVNTADAMLTYFRDGAVADRRRTVTGQPGNETPEIASPIFRLVAHPTWTVPESIEEEEIAPKGEDYLRRNNMVRRDGRIVQLSGPKNSLGQVKFDMRNDHAIYLHDTPAKTLFDREQRQLSHGCVRVQDALGFARMIAQQEGVLDQWNAAFASGEQTFVPLPREIRVRLLYHTAFVDGGRVQFRADPYGWDDGVAEALGFPARPRQARSGHVVDVGP